MPLNCDLNQLRTYLIEKYSVFHSEGFRKITHHQNACFSSTN